MGPSPQPSVAQLTETVRNMSLGQLRMVLRGAGITAIGMSDDQLRHMAQQVLSRKALPAYVPGPLARDPFTGHMLPASGAVIRRPPLVAEALRGEQGRILRGPVEQLLVPPGLTPKAARELEIPDFGKIQRAYQLRTPKLDIEESKIRDGIMLIRGSKGTILPASMDLTARIMDDIPLPNIRSYSVIGGC